MSLQQAISHLTDYLDGTAGMLQKTTQPELRQLDPVQCQTVVVQPRYNSFRQIIMAQLYQYCIIADLFQSPNLALKTKKS